MQNFYKDNRDRFMGLALSLGAGAALFSCSSHVITEWERAEAKEQAQLKSLRSGSQTLKILAFEPQERTHSAEFVGKELWQITALGAFFPADIMVAPKFRKAQNEVIANKYVTFQLPTFGEPEAKDGDSQHPSFVQKEVTYFGDGKIKFNLALPSAFNPTQLKIDQVMLKSPERACIRIGLENSSKK